MDVKIPENLQRAMAAEAEAARNARAQVGWESQTFIKVKSSKMFTTGNCSRG